MSNTLRKCTIITLIFSSLSLCQTIEYHGVFVGIKDWEEAWMGSLLYSENDAYDMKTQLTGWDNWQSNNTVVLYSEYATRSNIYQYVQAMPKSAGNMKLYFHSGHGTTDGLCTYNLDPPHYISPSDLQSWMGSAFNQYAVFLDACHSGVFADNMSKGFIGAACTANQTVQQFVGLGNGKFTYYLKEGLYYNYAGGDDEIVSASELFNYANQNNRAIYQNVTPQSRNNYGGTLNLKSVERNITFTNSRLAAPTAGTVTVNGTQYDAPKTWTVSKGFLVGVETAASVEINGLQYTFQNWKRGEDVVSSSTAFDYEPVSDATVTANYSVIPNAPTDLYISGDVDEQVVLNWTGNPNESVTYEIWRSSNKNTPYDSVTTVAHSATYWVDNSYKITSGYTDSLVHYHMYSRFDYGSYHSKSEPSQATCIYAKPGYEAKRAQSPVELVEIKSNWPMEYSVGNYPNPFNPTTTMFYQLVENSDVSLEVYDVAGRRVATVVDGERSAGYHAKVWSAKDKSGAILASGLYFYRFVARPISGHKPFVTSGKLLLMK